MRLLLGLFLAAGIASAQSDSGVAPGSGIGVQPTHVMVVDQDYVVDRSAALADMRPRVDRLTSAWEKGLNENRERLKSQNDLAVQTYAEGSAELTQIQADIQAELGLLGQEVERRKRRLNDININAIRLIRRQVSLMAQQVAVQRGANMVINKSQGIWVPVSLDATEEVLARMNAEYLQIVPLAEEVEAEILEASGG